LAYNIGKTLVVSHNLDKVDSVKVPMARMAFNKTYIFPYWIIVPILFQIGCGFLIARWSLCCWINL